MTDFRRVVVLKGGLSVEREVSLISGAVCADSLRRSGYEVFEIDAGISVVDQIRSVDPDVVFNALHGKWGEDGVIQGVLELMRIPYTHSGVLASALAMNKQKSKSVFRDSGLPVAESHTVSKEDACAGRVLPPPYVIKPIDEGSSIGIHLITHANQITIDMVSSLPDEVMIEAYIPGRELTCSVLGDKPLGVTEILLDGWYDYDAKYTPGVSRHAMPALIESQIRNLLMDYALRAHQSLGCRGLSRTDFRWNEACGLDGIFVLETNTQPGMTPLSLAPEQAEYAGIPFDDLCLWILNDASCNR